MNKSNSVRNACWIILTGAGACLVYFWIARVVRLNYAAKSLIKLALFLGLPAIYSMQKNQFSWPEVLSRIQMIPGKKQRLHLLRAVSAGLIIIVAANLLAEPLSRLFGIASIIAEIQARTQTTRERLWLALIYIPLVNALSEEIFFRSYTVLELTNLGYDRLALLYPAALFALYHLAIFQNWFSPGIMALTLACLFLCGLFLGHVVRRDRNVMGVWLLHGLVNVAIISISLQFF